MKIKLTEKQTLKMTFTHPNGKPASFFAAMNPLTGDWLQTHKVGDAESSYYGTKSAVLSLANSIVKKSAEKNLTCEVEVSNIKI
jgi:hypothetical protein